MICFWYVYCLNLCKPRTTTQPLWQPGPTGVTFYGSGLASVANFVGMGNLHWLCSMRPEIFLHIKFIIFWGFSQKLPVYLGSLLHIISLLTCHFRLRDYPEHFGIYSQVNRTNKMCFLDWAGKNPNLKQLPPLKFRYFPNHNRPKGDLMKMYFKNFQIEKCGSETVIR